MRAFLKVLTVFASIAIALVAVSVQVPCAMPVSLSIGSIDSRFSITRENLTRAVTDAAAVWEDIEGRKLFSIGENGDVPINVVFDDRQRIEDNLQALGSSISSGFAEQKELNDEYKSVRAVYDTAFATYEAHRTAFEERSTRYGRRIDEVQANPEATEADYAALRKEQKALEDVLSGLRAERKSLEAKRADVNALVDEGKTLVTAINETVDVYNDAADDRGEEFETGVYRSGPDGRTINLYVYSDQDQLTRLLTHELGHSLGLDHVADEQAIMYRLNLSKNISPTEADAAALKALCSWADEARLGAGIWERITSAFSAG